MTEPNKVTQVGPSLPSHLHPEAQIRSSCLEPSLPKPRREGPMCLVQQKLGGRPA